MQASPDATQTLQPVPQRAISAATQPPGETLLVVDWGVGAAAFPPDLPLQAWQSAAHQQRTPPQSKPLKQEGPWAAGDAPALRQAYACLADDAGLRRRLVARARTQSADRGLAGFVNTIETISSKLAPEA